MRMKGRILYIPFVSDTDFRLQLSTLHQLFGSATQSSRDRRYFSAFTGMYYLLLAFHQNTGKSFKIKINNHKHHFSWRKFLFDFNCSLALPTPTLNSFISEFFQKLKTKKVINFFLINVYSA